MVEDSDYLMICSNSYGRDILGSIDRTMRQLGAERAIEGRMKVWKRHGQVLGNGFSVGSAELARIHQDVLAPVQSALSTVPVHPLDDSTVVARSSQDMYQELLEMHGKWVLGLRSLYLVSLIAVVFVTSLRLLVFSGIFAQYEMLFEYWSYVIVLLPLSLGLGTLWYMYLGSRAVKLVHSVAEPGDNTALIVRFSREQGIDLPVHLSKDREDGPAVDASDKTPAAFTLAEAVSDHVSFSQYSLYVLTFSTDSQEMIMEQLHERGGLVLSIGRPYAIRRALFNIRIIYSLTLGLLFVVGLVLSSAMWTWLVGYLSMQFMVLSALSLLALLMAIRLLHKRVWLWLERRFFKK